MKYYRLTACIAVTAAILISSGCGEGKQGKTAASGVSLVDIVKDGDSEIYSIPFDAYKKDAEIKNLPIGVFDSGIGGLTVLSGILTADRFDNITREHGSDGRPDFENERFVYFGDQANMPYGNYPSEGKTDFLKELIIKDAVFILGNRYSLSAEAPSPRSDKPPVKAIVIACNTATAYGLDDVRYALEKWNLPIYLIGVVEAGAKGAIEAQQERNSGGIAVMATVGTCQSDGYPRAIEKAAAEAGIQLPGIIQQGSVGLAGAIEGDVTFIADPAQSGKHEYRGPSSDNSAAPIDPALAAIYGFEAGGLIGNPDNLSTWRLNSIVNYIRYDTATLVENHRKEGGNPIATVILGCTHFPFYKNRIAESFARLRTYRAPDGSRPYEAVVADSLVFIDPSEKTAEELYEALAVSGMLLTDESARPIEIDEFYISIPNPSQPGVALSPSGGFSYEYKYGRNTGDYTAEYTLNVPMSGANVSVNVRESIKKTMPEVWRRLTVFSDASPRTKALPESVRFK